MRNCIHCGKDFVPTSSVQMICPDCVKEAMKIDTSRKIDTIPDHEDFVKADNGKLRWSLIPFRELEDVVKVLEMGAQKYKVDNWKKCNDTKRYEDALMRHLVSYMKGDKIDKESGLNHMSHIICNALFLSYFDNEKVIEDDETKAWD